MARRTFSYIGFTVRGSGFPHFAILYVQNKKCRTFAIFPNGELLRLRGMKTRYANMEEITALTNYIPYRVGETFEHDPSHCNFAFARDDLYIGPLEALKLRMWNEIENLRAIPKRSEEQEETLISLMTAVQLAGTGVSYLQFASGVTVECTTDGKVKTCK